MRLLIRFGILFLLLGVLAAVLAGCSLPFYWQAATGQLSLMRKRVPIETILSDPEASAELKEVLSGIEQVRQFAIDELLLPASDSYTSYADIEREFVVWNVVATPEFSTSPQTWCFPFTGCVSYRGYFERENAERFRAKLDEEGLDTYLGGARAYSTLGFFDDPVLNTMIAGGPTYIASVLIHEMAHQKLYIKDDSDLSEAFASVIEEHGTRRWLARHGGAGEVALYDEWLERRSGFAGLVLRQQERLRQLFSGEMPDEDMRRAKAQAYEQMREEYEALKASWGGAGDYDAWFAQPLNNAALASVATYRFWQPILRARLEAHGLEAFYAELEAVAEMSASERTERLALWQAEFSARTAVSQPRQARLAVVGAHVGRHDTR